MKYYIVLKGRNDEHYNEMEVEKFISEFNISKDIVKGHRIVGLVGPKDEKPFDYVIVLQVKTSLLDYFRIKKMCNGYTPRFGMIFPMDTEEDLIKIREEFWKM